ncbi:MAG: hypothetical protein BGO11_03690 [Solirubrobacterales bacterium 70-9]|nr:MAG: hypothetical protein BGO11_03690 [Solirubrobacterales bacterium 70-9]
MGRIPRRLVVVLTLVVATAILAGCGGGGSSDPEDAIEAAAKHRDQLEGEFMLAEVELDKAYLAEDERTAKSKPRRAARLIDELIHSAEKIERRCRAGTGLESCTEMDAIEAVVGEIKEEARTGPGG